MKLRKHVKRSKIVLTFDGPKATNEAYNQMAGLCNRLISYAEKNGIRDVSVTAKRDREANKVTLITKGIDINKLLF